jgi:hypothetical protein
MIGKFCVLLTCSFLAFNTAPTHGVVHEIRPAVSNKINFFDYVIKKQSQETLKHHRKPENIKAYTLSSIKKYGWNSTQYSCLYSLWKKESNWHWYSYNKSSGAYGIPQATPGRKMRDAGKDWKTNPFTQIKWGLSYIKRNHGTPCNAWQHSKVHNWY